jgi:hypothetical protein
MTQISRLLPPLRIHSWGGFGSQLFTAYVILKVQKCHPGRRIKVIVHTSGITRRVSEFDFKILNVKEIQVEDFKDIKKDQKRKQGSRQNSRNTAKALKHRLFLTLVWLRFIQTADTENSFKLVSFWTVALRGHYTKLTLEKPIVQSLYEVLFSSNPEASNPNKDLVIHYRLGDLLRLDDKRPISVKRVEGVLEKFKIKSSPPVLLSDSSKQEVAKFLETSTVLKFSVPLNYNPIMTLKLCIDAQTFLGTGAKLSLWAAIFRFFILGKESFLPSELDWSHSTGLEAEWY